MKRGRKVTDVYMMTAFYSFKSTMLTNPPAKLYNTMKTQGLAPSSY